MDLCLGDDVDLAAQVRVPEERLAVVTCRARPTCLAWVASSPSPHGLDAALLALEGLPGDQGASFSS